MSYSKTMSSKSVLETALERINILYDRYDHIAVMFSGGKDSTVCLNLTLQVARERNRLPLDCVFWDEEAIPPETIEYMERVRRLPEVSLRWLCLPVKHRNGCSRSSPYWNCWALKDEKLWCRPLPTGEGVVTPYDMPDFPDLPIPECSHIIFSKKLGSVAEILGIRADESLRRFRIVTQRSYDNWLNLHATEKYLYKAKPIYDWTTPDVWTAPKMFGWDYNRTYDTMYKAGIPYSVQRCAPPYGEEPMQRLWQYAVCWPDLWEKMLARVPGATAGARYSRSPLYGFMHKPKSVPEGYKNWQEAIAAQIRRWAPSYQRVIAERVKDEIHLHNSLSDGAEIPDHLPGWVCSWSYLYMIAQRGDLKNRRKRYMSKEEYTAALIKAKAEKIALDAKRHVLNAAEIQALEDGVGLEEEDGMEEEIPDADGSIEEPLEAA